MTERAVLREVGLRDGLQLVSSVLSTERKLEWCRRARAAGVLEIEVTSFVPPSVVAQFVDAAEVARGAVAAMDADPAFRPSALVPNLKGAERAFAQGVPHITTVLSASEAHNLANVRRTTDASIADFARITMARDKAAQDGGPQRAVGAAIATSFGCTIQGAVDEGRVTDIARQLVAHGADEIVLADTVGYADPGAVRRLVAAVLAAVGPVPVACHFHDTRGLGLANVTAALDAGVRRFDASLGGLGGCPFAPGASGNIDSEDTAYLLEALGFSTGIDIDALVALRRTVETWLPHERFAGAVARAGLPKTFQRAAA